MLAEIEPHAIVRFHLDSHRDKLGRSGIVAGVVHAVDCRIVEAVLTMALHFGEHLLSALNAVAHDVAALLDGQCSVLALCKRPKGRATHSLTPSFSTFR